MCMYYNYAAAVYMYMEIHVHSTLAKEKKGKVTHPTIAQTNKHIIARDTWMPSLENWGGGLKIFCVHVYIYMYMYIINYRLKALHA